MIKAERIDLKRTLVMGPQWHIAMFRHTFRNDVRKRKPQSWSGWFYNRTRHHERSQKLREAMQG